MGQYLDSFKFGEIPAKKSSKSESFFNVYNNFSGKTRNLIGEKIPSIKAVSNEINDSSGLNIGGKVREETHSSLKIIYKKGESFAIKTAENVANFGKDNFINPYPNAQLNTIDLFLGKWIDNGQPSVFPKLVKSTVIGSYAGKWLDTVLMPTRIPHFASKTRNKLNGIFIPPFSWSFNKINNGYKKIKKFVLPKEMYKKNIENKKNRRLKFREKITKPLGRLRNWVNKKISFRSKNISKLQQKNEEFHENLKDAA